MELTQEEKDQLASEQRSNLIANLGQAFSGAVTGQNSAGGYYLGMPNKGDDGAQFYQGLRDQAKEPRQAKLDALKSQMAKFELLKNDREKSQWEQEDKKAAALKDPSSPESLAIDSGYRAKQFALAAALKDTDPKQAALIYREAMSPLRRSGLEATQLDAQSKAMTDLAPKLYEQKQKGMIDLANKRTELAMKPKDVKKELPAETLGKLGEEKDMLDTSQSLVNLTGKIPTGYFSKKANKLLALAGIEDAETAKIRSQLANTRNQMIHAIAGSSMTPSEKENAMEMIPEEGDSEESFKGKAIGLNELLSKKYKAKIDSLGTAYNTAGLEYNKPIEADKTKDYLDPKADPTKMTTEQKLEWIKVHGGSKNVSR